MKQLTNHPEFNSILRERTWHARARTKTRSPADMLTVAMVETAVSDECAPAKYGIGSATKEGSAFFNGGTVVVPIFNCCK